MMFFLVRRGWLVLLLLFLAGCATPPAPEVSAPPSPGARVSEVDARMARMTLEQKIAQLMIVGFDGTASDAGLRDLVEHAQVGGVIFFARNIQSPAQLAGLTNELQARAQASGAPGLFLAIDQEGGRVARLTEDKGFAEFPGAMAIGASAASVDEAANNARRVGAAIGAEMRAVGLNLDFAPDLDVNNNPANPVIGVRSFGAEPQRVARLGVAFAEGLQGAGILAFGKHFPGHGDTGTDSHVELPVVNHPRARLEAVEFVPFRAAIAKGIAGIMSAHVSFPTIDATPGLPGTLSPKVLTDLLRHDLGFGGLVVTDSLEMGALGKSGFPAPQAAARALAAGADLLLFNSGYALHHAAIAQIAADVREGRISPVRLDDAVRRVLQAKQRFGVLHPAPVDPAQVAARVGTVEHRALADEIATSAITVVRDDAHLVPLAPTTRPLVVGAGGASELARLVRGVEVRVPGQPAASDLAAVRRAIHARRQPTVVLTLSAAKASRAQTALVRDILATGARVVVVALREPYDLALAAGKKRAALIATYGGNPPALRALARVLLGEAKATGQLPVKVPGL